MHRSPPGANGTICVHVTLPGALAKYRPTPCNRSSFAVTLQRGSTLQDLLAALRVPPEMPKELFVNRQRGQPGDVLPPAADVEIFPALGIGPTG